jgi:hypothetical protein
LRFAAVRPAKKGVRHRFTKFIQAAENLSMGGSIFWKIASFGGKAVYWMEKIARAQAEIAERNADPFRRPVANIMSCIGDSVSTAALLDLLGLPKTTGNGRRIARTMRALGFIPIKSRCLMPGGYRDTVTRGWARPVREPNRTSNIRQGAKVEAFKV